jgi:hypothetical protein
MLRNLSVQFLKIFLASSCIVFFNCTMIKSSSKDKTPEFKIELSGGSLVPVKLTLLFWYSLIVFQAAQNICHPHLQRMRAKPTNFA